MKTQPLNMSAHLKTDEDIQAFANVMLEENGEAGLISAIEQIAKVKGIQNLPSQNIFNDIKALGLKLSVQMAA